jgi:hypothetical protein
MREESSSTASGAGHRLELLCGCTGRTGRPSLDRWYLRQGLVQYFGSLPARPRTTILGRFPYGPTRTAPVRPPGSETGRGRAGRGRVGASGRARRGRAGRSARRATSAPVNPAPSPRFAPTACPQYQPHDCRTRIPGFSGSRAARDPMPHVFHRRRSRMYRACCPRPPTPGVAPGSVSPPAQPGFGPGIVPTSDGADTATARDAMGGEIRTRPPRRPRR